jgi:hypothetical protein
LLLFPSHLNIMKSMLRPMIMIKKLDKNIISTGYLKNLIFKR